MKIFKQIFMILTICIAGEIIAKYLPVAFPSSVISLVILLILLSTKIIKPKHIKEVSEFLLHNMAFFFVPAGVYIMGSFHLIRREILILVFICLLTTVITFMVTAYTILFVMKLLGRKKEREH